MAVNPRLLELLQFEEREAIGSFLHRFSAHYPGRVSGAVLFGSKARGCSHSESDIDILLIVDEDDWRFRHSVSDVAANVSLEYGVLIGPRVIGQERWARMAREHFSLYENVAREGIPLTMELA